MKPYYEHAGITIYHGDCRDVLPSIDGVDITVSSPPYNAIAPAVASGMMREAHHKQLSGYLSHDDGMESFAEHWDCHSWDNCPMAYAFDVKRLEDVPLLLRPRADQFVQLFDAKQIPWPLPTKADLAKQS